MHAKTHLVYANFYSVRGEISHVQDKYYHVQSSCTTLHELFLRVHGIFKAACTVLKLCTNSYTLQKSVTCNHSVTVKHEQYQSGYRLRYKSGKRIFMCAYVCACACMCACARTCIIIIINIVTFIYLYARSRINTEFEAVTRFVTK